MTVLFQTLFLFLRVMEAAIFAFFLLSLFAPQSKPAYYVGRFIGPFIHPFRVLNQKLLGRFALPVDLSLLFALIGIDVLRYLLQRLYLLLL